MRSKIKFLKLWKLVQRENAARYMIISLLSSIATLTLVRTFLSLTGYPQIGSGTLHIAHVLWGGLILYIAAILSLIYLNRRINMVVAILSGVGVGLFLDEVGKFITRQYDYFFPAAAPIIYVFFLLVVVLAILVNRPEEIDGRSELVRALEIVQQELYRPLEAIEKGRIEQDLNKVINNDPIPLHVDLAQQLLEFLHADSRSVAETSPAWWLRIVVKLQGWLTETRLRWLLEAGMVLLALVTLKNPLLAWLEQVIPGSRIVNFLHISYGRQIPSIDAPGLFAARLAVEVLVVILLFLSLSLFVLKRRRLAINIGYLSLLISLVILDMMLFYFEQFSTVILVFFQIILFTGVMYYRRKYLQENL